MRGRRKGVLALALAYGLVLLTVPLLANASGGFDGSFAAADVSDLLNFLENYQIEQSVTLTGKSQCLPLKHFHDPSKQQCKLQHLQTGLRLPSAARSDITYLPPLVQPTVA